MTRPRYLMKTVDSGGAAYDGFRWPLAVGAEVAAPDWSDAAECGGGLHGLADGVGDGVLLNWDASAIWVVAEIPGDARVVDLDGKVKVDRCVVAHVGDRESAPRFLVDAGCTGPIVAASATAGDGGTATAGYGGTATAGHNGTATAGHYGSATAGYGGTATAGDDGTATAGDDGTATAGYDGTATAGDGGTATAGYGGTATAGDGGILVLTWWDGRRYRRKAAAVGENGVLANVRYRLDDEGNFVAAEAVS